MRLSAHLVVPDGDDIEHGAVGREEGVEREAEICFLDFLGEVREI